MAYVNIILESKFVKEGYVGAAAVCKAYINDKYSSSVKKVVVDSSTSNSSLIVLIGMLQDIVEGSITHINFIADERPGQKHNSFIKNVIMYSRRWRDNEWLTQNGEELKCKDLVQEYLEEIERLDVSVLLTRSDELTTPIEVTRGSKEEMKALAKEAAVKEMAKHRKIKEGPVFYSEVETIDEEATA